MLEVSSEGVVYQRVWHHSVQSGRVKGSEVLPVHSKAGGCLQQESTAVRSSTAGLCVNLEYTCVFGERVCVHCSTGV